MKGLSKLTKTTFLFALALFFGNAMNAQCTNWTELSADDKEKAEDAHVVYRQFIKSEDFKAAEEMWRIAYDLAPAADGQRAFHYMDGRAIYMDKFKNETDEAKKKEHAAQILKFYEEEIACYGEGKNKPYLLGRQAYDMYYTLRSPYSKLLPVLEEAVKLGGNDTEYIVLDPYARVVSYEFAEERLDAETARNAYTKLNEIADHNIANNEEFPEQYQQAKDAMNGTFAQIENFIFDCDYFYERLIPEYKANPNDRDNYLNVYKTLLARGCDPKDPVLSEIKMKDSLYVMKNLIDSNPKYAAGLLYKEGKYPEAIAKYQEALSQETDPKEQAGLHFSIASIQYRKQGKSGPARESARKALSLDPSYGKAYGLIGDMYAKASRNCGSNSYENSLAVLAAIDKYAKAKSVDPSISGDMNKKIGIYSKSKPRSEECFMRGVKEGDVVKVPCWVGETVTVRF